MIDKLIQKIQKTGAPVVVGLDPTMKFVPDHIRKAAFDEMGETLEGAAEAVWQFNKAIVDSTCDLIPAVKPQIAMYEQFGIPGLAAFKKTVDYCREKGLVVIGDVKRGDIGSTSAAYAAAHLGRVQVGSSLCAGFEEDFVTVNPYLGSDGVQPTCAGRKSGGSSFLSRRPTRAAASFRTDCCGRVSLRGQRVRTREVSRSRTSRSTRWSAKRLPSGASSSWERTATAISAQWWAPHIRNRAACSAG